jgi:MFS family permease
MRLILQRLTFPILSLVLLILGSGLFNTFVSIRLEQLGTNTKMIGLITSVFYGGILAGSIRSPLWLSRLGYLRFLVALCAANSVLILLHALWINPLYWAFLRFLNGVLMGSIFVVIESWFLLIGSASMRSRVLSAYLFIFYIALSAGQQLLNAADLATLIPYCLASALSSLSILPIVIAAIETPASCPSPPISFLKIFSSSPSSYTGGVISGMLLASIYGLGPVYGQNSGLSISEIATLMSVIVMGGVSLQWPLGKWADVFNRKAVLAIACFAAALLSSLVAFIDLSWPLKLVLLWLFGGFSFVLYPLSMATACEGVAEEQVVAATGGFVLSYGIGAIAGPLLAPHFMHWFGYSGLFYFQAFICLGLGLITLLTLRKI